jgi:hypothetical protein
MQCKVFWANGEILKFVSIIIPAYTFCKLRFLVKIYFYGND